MHAGRLSRPEARYFLTVCTLERKPGLAGSEIAAALHSAWADMQANDDIQILCRTIMPDHVHILAELGHRLTIGQVIGKWKTLTRMALQKQGLAWQRDFFERRLRPDDEQESFGRYIFLNPYTAKLVSLDQVWPYWRLDSPEAFAFPSMLREGLYPHPEWLAKNDEWRTIRGW
jgi:REP element-mobilizing transposase RayT